MASNATKKLVCSKELIFLNLKNPRLLVMSVSDDNSDSSSNDGVDQFTDSHEPISNGHFKMGRIRDTRNLDH